MDDAKYRYLFWESEHSEPIELSPSTGFAIEKKTIVSFLESSLKKFGFTTEEQADFITYWAPKMIKYPACKIQFVFNEACNQFAQLKVQPRPDNIYRFYIK